MHNSNDLSESRMRIALQEAELAAQEGEVPVGAVIVDDESGEVIAKAHNRVEANGDATAHAELLAIQIACRKRGRRLENCTLYVTLEPCPMCGGAAIGARIPRIVFAAKDPRAGAFGSLLNLSQYPLESCPQCNRGAFAEESLALLRTFFEKKRRK